jgi:hypothetical protein
MILGTSMSEPLKTTRLDSIEITVARALVGYGVSDLNGARIGALDGIWVDPSTDQPEFFGIALKNNIKRAAVIPARFGTVDPTRKIVTVPFTETLVNSAPTFPSDSELAEVQKQQITTHFDCSVPVERVTALADIRPEESNDTRPDQGESGKQSVNRHDMEKEDQSFFEQKGFVTDSMPSVDASKNLEKTQREAKTREAEDDGRGD